MAVTSAQVAATTTPAALTAVDTDTIRGQRLTIKNTGASVVYVGPAAVNASTGYAVAASEVLSVVLESSDDAPYVFCATTGSVSVLRTGA